MKNLISVLISFSFISVTATAASKKRKLAQAKVQCVELDKPFDVYANSDSVEYTVDEFRMLRNSIFAAHGFKFKSAAVTEEMARRGCTKIGETPLSSIDKKNVKYIKNFERSLKEEDNMANFMENWAKTPAHKRAAMLSGNYCFLTDSKSTHNDYLGLVFFNADKNSGNRQLDGMMDINKPSWAEPISKGEQAEYTNSIVYKEIDTTAAVSLLDYPTKGSWRIETASKDKGELFITIEAKSRDVKDKQVKISAENYKEKGMLTCTVAN